MLRRRELVLAMITGLLSQLAGCSGGPDLCSADSDCGAGSVCLEQSQTCIDRAQITVGLEVVPPANNQGWVKQEFPQPERDASGHVTLRLKESVSFQGTVIASDQQRRTESATPTDPWIPARVSVWRESRLPGRPKLQVEVSTDRPSTDGRADESGRFVLWLEPGYTYHALVQPLGQHEVDFPPLKTQLSVTDHLVRALVLHGQDQSVAVRGRVLDAVGDPLPFSVRVRAFKPDSWLRSTPSWTCSEGSSKTNQGCPDGQFKQPEDSGRFQVRIPHGPDTYSLRVEPAPFRGESAYGGPGPVPLIPALECSGKTLGLVQANQTSALAVQEIADIKLPPFTYASPYSVAVVGVTGDPVPSAQVHFELRGMEVKTGLGFTDCSAQYQVAVATDSAGKATLPLLPLMGEDAYTATVTPTADSPFAAKQLPIEVGPHGGVLQTIVLEPRFPVSGSVMRDGVPLSGAAVELSSSAATNQTGGGRSASAGLTNEQGEFTIHAEPGVYDIHVRPPEESGLPWFSVDQQAIEARVDGLTLPAPESQVLEGTVLAADGSPAVGFVVNYYALTPGPPDAASQPESATSVLRATAVTNETGGFRLLLPR